MAQLTRWRDARLRADLLLLRLVRPLAHCSALPLVGKHNLVVPAARLFCLLAHFVRIQIARSREETLRHRIQGLAAEPQHLHETFLGWHWRLADRGGDRRGHNGRGEAGSHCKTGRTFRPAQKFHHVFPLIILGRRRCDP